LSSKKKRDWKKYNEELVRRGELLFDPDFLSGWEEELNKMNEKKEGAKYLSLSKLINEYARSHSCISSLLETDRGVSKGVRRAYRRIQKKNS
jgi:hypothetical protein